VYYTGGDPAEYKAEYEVIVERPVYCKRCQALYDYAEGLQANKENDEDPDIRFGTAEFRNWME